MKIKKPLNAILCWTTCLFLTSLSAPLARAQFVTRTNQQFIYQGYPITFYGCSIDPAAEGYTGAWFQTNFTSSLHSFVTNAMNVGQNIIRPVDFLDGSHTNYNDPTLEANLNFLLSDCQSNGMFVLMDISAWKLVLDAQSLSETDTNNWLVFLNTIVPRYATNQAIAFWSIMGEPSVPTNQSSANSLIQFYGTLTSYIYSKDANHLICAGAFINMEEDDQYQWWQGIYALPHNDICGYKTYSKNDLNLTPSIGFCAQTNNKILLNEEFGMPQYMGDGKWSGSNYNSIATSVSTFYTNVYNEGLTNGATGFQFWNLDNNQGGNNYDIWPTYMPVTWSTVQHYSPPPQPPLNLSAAAVTGQSAIDLAWTLSPEAIVTGYNIYRSTVSGFTPSSGNRIQTGWTGSSYSDTGLTPGITYYYLVTAINTLSKESAASDQAGATVSGSVSGVNAVSINFVGGGSSLSSSQSAGVVAETNWNNASGTSGNNQMLVDSSGAFDNATVTWSANHTSSEGIGGSTANDVMMNGYLNTATNTTTTVTVSGLPANTNGWIVYVYGQEDITSTRTAAYQISGTGITTMTIDATDPTGGFSGAFTQANNSTGNYVEFPIGNVSSFTISATPVSASDGTLRAPLNGIQIIPAPPSISINFVGGGSSLSSSQSAGVITEVNWNNESGSSGSNQSLVDSTGASDGAEVTWSANHTSSEGLGGTTANDVMMNGYLNTSTNTTTTVTVTNLPASTNGWNIFVYCQENITSTRVAAYKISGSGITATTIDATDPTGGFGGTFTQATNSTGNYVEFPIGNVNSFTISATPVSASDGTLRAPLNGIQIIP